MKKSIFIKFLCLITFFSFVAYCSPKYKKQLVGTWTIDMVNKKGEEITYKYLSNLISFKNNGICSLPRTNRSEKKMANG